ncbi:hypothetical protein D3C80_2179480 [compost metagenome]
MPFEQVGIEHRRTRNMHGFIACQLGIEPVARVFGADGEGPAIVNVDHVPY